MTEEEMIGSPNDFSIIPWVLDLFRASFFDFGFSAARA
jgi:hypothetical protein